MIYLLVIIGQMAYAIYDNALISKNNAFAFEYLFNTVQPFGVDETMIGAIAIFLFVPIVGAALAIYIAYAFLGAVGLYWPRILPIS